MKIKTKEGDTMTTKLNVEGMVCNHCAGAIKAELASIDGVQDVIVDLTQKTVTVEHDTKVNVDCLKESINDLGYEVVG